MARDPVCGMNVKEDCPSNLRSEYKGREYRFCSDRCREEFDRNPESYVSREQQRLESRESRSDLRGNREKRSERPR
ncbi:MAG TPA: YHS domain-containing protein [Firmicutes bacterium]|nr:YHS domain-containing protein [Candidatus Fermentithermobacillaceae bacterium]